MGRSPTKSVYGKENTALLGRKRKNYRFISSILLKSGLFGIF
jgi:hypothetical protein